MALPRAHELDHVELVRDIGEWKAGTRGTVVSEYPESALIEVSTEASLDEDGLPERDLLDDLFSAPYSALRIVEPASTAAR